MIAPWGRRQFTVWLRQRITIRETTAAIAFGGETAGNFGIALLAILYRVACIRILTFVVSGRHVTTDRIYGEICVYLLLRHRWTSTYLR